MNVPNDSLPQLPPTREVTERLLELIRTEGRWRDPEHHLDSAHHAVVERDQSLSAAVRFAREGYVNLAENAIRLWCSWEADARASVNRARELIAECEVDQGAER
jgi:hypothetical protein